MNSKTLTPALILILFILSINIPVMPASDSPVPAKLDGLDQFIEKGMGEWSIPGLSVSVVKDGDIVFAKGFGVRKLGANDLVDENTIFGVASTTKAMTVTALAMLVDEGKISWDDRVRDHLPWFELSDPWVSDIVTIRDLLSHKVGLGRLTGNRLIFMPDRDRRTILKHVRHMPFEIPFRSGYLYSNMMYMVAGLIIEAVEGKTWDEFLPERLFEPLGMTTASTTINAISDDDNAAWPHQEINGSVQIIPRRNFDNVGPAASVNASASDMAKWMLLNLGEPGTFGDKLLVSKHVMTEIFQPQYVFEVRDPMTGNFSAYTMGWNAGYYEKHRILQHGGATDGINSLILLMPEEDLGIFIAGNLFCELRPAVASWILDRFLDIERDHNWSELYLQQYLSEKESLLEERKKMEEARITGTSTTLPLSSYTGRYVDKVYDDVEVKINGEGLLELCFWGDPGAVATLEHWHFDTFRATWKNPAMREKFVNFDLDQEGNVRQLNVTFSLRPPMIEVGLYPATYNRIVEYKKDITR